MKAFDADVLTLILQGDPACVHKASLIPILEQGTPVVVIEEILRGRLNGRRDRHRHRRPVLAGRRDR